MQCTFLWEVVASFPGVSTYKAEPRIEVIGVEAEGGTLHEGCFEAGGPVKLPEIDKFADGIAVQKVGQLTYEVTVGMWNPGWGRWVWFQRLWLIFILSKELLPNSAGAASVASRILREYIR